MKKPMSVVFCLLSFTLAADEARVKSKLESVEEWGEFHRSKMIYDWFVRYPERIGYSYVTIG